MPSLEYQQDSEHLHKYYYYSNVDPDAAAGKNVSSKDSSKDQYKRQQLQASPAMSSASGL